MARSAPTLLGLTVSFVAGMATHSQLAPTDDQPLLPKRRVVATPALPSEAEVTIGVIQRRRETAVRKRRRSPRPSADRERSGSPSRVAQALAVPPFPYHIPAWGIEALACLNQYEESGAWQTAAGGLGFVYPPSAYSPLGPQLAQVYGDSWETWPQAAQLQVGWQVYLQSGWSAWSTAGSCGLG